MNAQILHFPVQQDVISPADATAHSEILSAAWDASMEAVQVFVQENGDNREHGGACVVFEDPDSAFVRLLMIKGIGEHTKTGEWRISLLQGLPYKSRRAYVAGCDAFVKELELRDISARVDSFAKAKECL
ncbi:hypothetical protein ACQU0X_25955 [Pseudovibrio ascidiaceicola]|uniref:hypothetical protein n=1 Tax=Pseudovibrio ascidiaceicola TaxID=285279 RepID=UPI003D3623C8